MTITLDILKPQIYVSNAIASSIRNSLSHTLISAQDGYINFESKMTFFDYGCVFDLYVQPTSPSSVRIVLNGRVRFGIDIFNIAKRRGESALAMFIHNMNLTNNQYRYGSY